VSSGPNLSQLYSGATGQRAYRDTQRGLAAVRAAGQRSWDAATPLAREAGLARQEVMGAREQHQPSPRSPAAGLGGASL
jgi:hypothetical protein